MKRSLFILQLCCLLISNFNYSTEDLTKKVGESLTKQILVTIGSSLVLTGIINKEKVCTWGAWGIEAITNHLSHRKTQNKVDATQNFLRIELQPTIQLGFKDITTQLQTNHDISHTLLTTIDTNTKDLKPDLTIIKTDISDSKTKISALLNKNTEIINNYLSPIKADTEIIKQTTDESLALNKVIHRDIREIKEFFNIADKKNNN
jgi:hypothetical protein